MNANEILALKGASPEYKAKALSEMGYRRISNSHRIISRVDRPDFVQVLAEKLHRAPADFYIPGRDTVDGHWCDHYRRCFSHDKIDGVPEEIFKLIPGSNHDACGYVHLKEKQDPIATAQFFGGYVEIFSGTQPPLADANSEWPKEGSKWLSDKGNIFTVLGISNANPSAIYTTVNVVYRDQDDNLFSMPFSRWRAADYLMPIPKAGSKWKHKNGTDYVVLGVTNLSASKARLGEYPATISYKRLKDGTEWSRPLSRWAGSFTPSE